MALKKYNGVVIIMSSTFKPFKRSRLTRLEARSHEVKVNNAANKVSEFSTTNLLNPEYITVYRISGSDIIFWT